MNLPAALVALLLVASLVPLGALAQAQGTGVEYQLIIDCPGTRAVTPGFSTCPVQAIDGADAMGDPELAVDPLAPENLVIASLHGSGDCGGPTPRSRCGQTFTTFTSTDHGASWYDNPFYPPSQVDGAYGEHPAITIDPYGRVYVGSLYAEATEQEGVFDYVIAAQKFSSLMTINSEQDGEYNTEYLPPVYHGNAIGQMWFVFNPQTDNMTMVWHESVTPGSTGYSKLPVCESKPSSARPSSSTSTSSSSSSSASNTSSTSSTSSSSTSSGPSSSSGTSTSSSTSSTTGTTSSSTGTTTSALHRIVPFAAGPAPRLPALAAQDRPQESTAQAPASAPGNATPRGVIGVVWTGAASKSCYNYQDHENAIGPCAASTNPVLFGGWLYVGCVSRTDQGPFAWHPDTIPGTVELFRMDPDGGAPQYLGPSPIVGGAHPKLGVRSDGRLVVASTGAKDGLLNFDIAFGQYRESTKRIEWSSHQGLGSQIEEVGNGLTILDANVQDLIYREHSGVVQLVLKERVSGNGLAAGVTNALTPHLRKAIVAIDEDYGLLAKLDLDIGNLVNRTQDNTLLQMPESTFDDLSDDFLQLPEQDVYEYDGQPLEHYQREFFAVADYGIVIFAEVIEKTNLHGPAWPLANPAVPPNPAPATSSSTVGATVPAAGLTLVGALSLALLANKRKDPALTKARK